MRTRNFLLVIMIAAPLLAQAQRAPGGSGATKPVPDSNMIFYSPRPLVEPADAHQYRDAWGLDILFSDFGFGGGVFYRHEYSPNVFGFVTMEFSGVKNSNEITLYDYYTNSYLPPAGKLNDVYIIPLAIGVQYRLFTDAIAESFRPYINAGAGPAILIAAPDSLAFFSGFAHAAVHLVPDFFIGIGANIGKDKRTVSGVNFRYYYIPFKPGVQSIIDQPLYDLGGFFITLNWGLTY